MIWWWTGFWEQMNLQDFTSVWDLLELLFAEILQFVFQLTDRFSQTISREERTEEIVIYVCRFRKCWERWETLQKTEIKTNQLHTSPNNLHQHQMCAALVDLVSRSQTFRLTAEGLKSMVAFIGQGPPMMPFGQHQTTNHSSIRSVSRFGAWKCLHNNRPVCETVRCFLKILCCEL